MKGQPLGATLQHALAIGIGACLSISACPRMGGGRRRGGMGRRLGIVAYAGAAGSWHMTTPVMTSKSHVEQQVLNCE